MQLFFQILIASAVLVFVLIAVHECGHWVFGRLSGIPADQMRIRLLTFPQRVELRGETGWLTVDEHDHYMSRLQAWVPGRRGRFAFVAGGFLAETVFILTLSLALLAAGSQLLALVAVGVSLSMYLIYLLAMDLPQSRRFKRPWGDSSILMSIARGPAIALAVFMFVARLALIAMAAGVG